MSGAADSNNFTERHERVHLAPTGGVARDVDCAVRTEAAILISGNCELATAIARLVHDHRPAPASFVVIDCGQDEALSRALPEALDDGSPGERTVLLRNIDRLTPSQQSFVVSQLGSDAGRSRRGGRVRVIATTSVALFERVSRGAFDQKLFYCLNTVHIVVPD